VIVRLSDGTEASKQNAVLVNAHTDSTLPSPGAADDLVGVAAMLEALRVMALKPRRLTNSVVFRTLPSLPLYIRIAADHDTSAVFNGAEESLQDASHMFITQHPLKDTIRAVINLEACGVGGPEIVFQATSEEVRL
jgi:Zn-dependent M28 family amino/carboxypeptidase